MHYSHVLSLKLGPFHALEMVESPDKIIGEHDNIFRRGKHFCMGVRPQ